MDITKDSKYLLAASSTNGLFLYDVVKGGPPLKNVPIKAKINFHVEFSFGDQNLLVLSENDQRTTCRLFKFADILNSKKDDDGSKVEPYRTIDQPNADTKFT